MAFLKCPKHLGVQQTWDLESSNGWTHHRHWWWLWVEQKSDDAHVGLSGCRGHRWAEWMDKTRTWEKQGVKTYIQYEGRRLK